MSIIIATVKRTARAWKQEAERRRSISETDPVADALDYCASEVLARLVAAEVADEYETVEERAKRENVTPQTVRNWIRTHQLAAEEGPKGYRIQRKAERQRRSA